eukprot:gene23257-biopygen16333
MAGVSCGHNVQCCTTVCVHRCGVAGPSPFLSSLEAELRRRDAQVAELNDESTRLRRGKMTVGAHPPSGVFKGVCLMPDGAGRVQQPFPKADGGQRASRSAVGLLQYHVVCHNPHPSLDPKSGQGGLSH